MSDMTSSLSTGNDLNISDGGRHCRPTDLPCANHAVVESIYHVKDVGFPERHLALLRGVVVEMGPEMTTIEAIKSRIC